MKILITGVAGAIGSHLAERFVDLGHEVIGIDALTDYYSTDIKKINLAEVRAHGVQAHVKDLATDNLDSLMEGVEIVFHLAAQPGISAATSFDDYLKNNIQATHQLLEAAKKNKSLKMFFHASTSSVYGLRAQGDEESEPKPTSFYGVTKLAAEQLALAYYRSWDVPVSVLRFFSVYGERERPDKFYHRLIRAMYEDREVPLFEGSEYHRRTYTYVGDLVEGCVQALGSLEKVIGEIFNLGGTESITTAEGIKYVEEIMGKKAKIKRLPPRSGDQFETHANIEKAQKTFGYHPTTTFEKGIAAQVKWYGERVHGKVK